MWGRGIWYEAITEVKQLGSRSVLGWVTVGPQPAYRNTKWEVTFSETVDWRQTLLNGRLYRHIFKGETSGGKKVKERGNEKKGEMGKRGWGHVKGNSRTSGNGNTSKKIQLYRILHRNFSLKISLITDAVVLDTWFVRKVMTVILLWSKSSHWHYFSDKPCIF